MATTKCEMPEDLIRALHPTPPPRFQPGGRERAANWLRSALVDFSDLDRHIGLLQELYDSQFHYPRARRDCWSHEQVMVAPTKTPFRFIERLDEQQVLAVIEGGPDSFKDTKIISDEKLGELLLNPFALYDLFDVIDDVLPEAWLNVINERGNELAKQGRQSETLPGTSSILPTRNTVRWPQLGQRWLIGAAIAMAACLLLTAGVFIDRVLLRDLRASGPHHIQVALRDGKVRGQNNEDLRLEIHSDLDGFAMIVALTPGQRQEVLPGIGGDPVRVKPGEAGLSTPFPATVSQASVALVIITETPADGAIRRSLRDRVYAPEQVDQLQTDLQKHLETQNYLRIGFKRVDLKAAK